MDPHRGGNPSECFGSTPTVRLLGHETKKQTHQDLEIDLLRARSEKGVTPFLKKLEEYKTLRCKDSLESKCLLSCCIPH